MPITNIKSRWRQGFLEFTSTEGDDIEVVNAMAPVKYFLEFNGPAIDTTNDVNQTAIGAGAITTVDGLGTITTAAGDDDNVEIASDLVFKAGYGCVCEARIRNDDIAGQGYFFGFSDAITEGADSLPIDYSGGAGALVSDADDCAGFFMDPDKTDASIMCGSTIATTASTPIDTGTDAVNATWHTYRVELDTAGNAYYYFDGAYVGTDTLAITTTDPLCVYLGTINREGFANTLDVSYIRAWGGRQ